MRKKKSASKKTKKIKRGKTTLSKKSKSAVSNIRLRQKTLIGDRRQKSLQKPTKKPNGSVIKVLKNNIEKVKTPVSKKTPRIKNIISSMKTKETEVMNMGVFKKPDMSKKSSSAKKITAKASAKRTKSTKKKKFSLKPISELKSLFRKKPFHTKPIDNVQGEQLVEESKYYVSLASVQTVVQEDKLYELPAGYGDNRIVIQVRDPYWIHAYWEITQKRIDDQCQKFGIKLEQTKRILRVYDVTNLVFNGTNANRFFDIDINDYANNWYINVGQPGRSYCVDIGLILPSGQFVLLVRSNFVTTPIDEPSQITDEEWMVVEEDFNRLYGLSAGLGIGLSSMELRKRIKQRIKSVSSGIMSSPQAAQRIPARNFWLVVNTELIVYGATEPGAQVTIQDKPVALNKDGTFSLRFSLPDGQQVIPVKAVSPDKIEERIITPVVKKETT